MSFLEMFDVLNERLISEGEDPIAFDHDCREGICGACSMYVNGRAHGPWEKNTVCQLHMRAFKDGDTIVVEPWRSIAFPVIKDLVVDRGAFDRIIQAGGYVSVNTGNAVDANATPIEKYRADQSFSAAACIGCGACVAACLMGLQCCLSALKFRSLLYCHRETLKEKREFKIWSLKMDKEAFGNCTNIYACEAECPKGISVSNIARMNREYLGAGMSSEE